VRGRKVQGLPQAVMDHFGREVSGRKTGHGQIIVRNENRTSWVFCAVRMNRKLQTELAEEQ